MDYSLAFDFESKSLRIAVRFSDPPKFYAGENNVVVMEYKSTFDCRGYSAWDIQKLDCKKAMMDKFEIKTSRLTSLDGVPIKANRISVQESNLKSLDCSYTEVSEFVISNNKLLTSLKGSPQKTKVYSADRCGLTSLDCDEISVEQRFNVNGNYLTSLEGCPKYAHILWANNNSLQILKCQHAVIGILHVNNNKELKNLSNGPSKCRAIMANSCGLQTIDCNSEVDSLNVTDNPHLRLIGLPNLLSLAVTVNVKCLLRVCGRVRKVIIWSELSGVKNDEVTKLAEIEPSNSVFRQKLELRKQGIRATL